jgi:hypothetical protein
MGQKWRKTKQGRGEGGGGECTKFQCEMYIFGNKYYFIVTTLVTRVVNWLPKLIGTLIPKVSFKTCLSITYKLILKISCQNKLINKLYI